MRKTVFRFTSFLDNLLLKFNSSIVNPYQPIGANIREEHFTVDMIIVEKESNYERTGANRVNRWTN